MARDFRDSPDSDTGTSHPNCRAERGHVCAEPSGRACLEAGCDEAAGTRWGPYFCPVHDQERLDRIDARLAELSKAVQP